MSALQMQTYLSVVDDLATLSAEIDRVVTDAEAHARSAVGAAIAAGGLLKRAKDAVGHGGWDAWLRENCRVAPRTARAYMRLHAQYQSLGPDERQRVAEMPLRQAIAAIATNPATPPSYGRLVRHPAENARAPMVASLRNGVVAIRDVAKMLELHGPLKAGKVKTARAKLIAALDALDALTSASADANGVTA